MQDNTCVCCGRIIPEGRHICLSCGSYDDMQTFRPSSRAYYPEPPKVTNADRIRQMTDEELVKSIGLSCKRCAYYKVGHGEFCGQDKECTDGNLEWLKREVSEDASD